MLEILPLLVFTTCGGIAAGAYVVSAFAGLCVPGSMLDAMKSKSSAQNDGGKTGDAQSKKAEGAEEAHTTTEGNALSVAEKFNLNRTWLFPLVCIALLGIGLLGTLMHLGQPLRFINGMANPASMISQESYWAIAFGVLMVVDFLLAKTKGQPLMVIRWLAAIAACGLMFVTGLAYFDCYFIAPWSDAITIPLFIVGDLAMGAGLCLLFADHKERSVLHILNVATCAVWLAVACAYAVFGADLGMQVGVIVAGMIIGAIGSAIVSIAHIQGKLSEQNAAIAVLVCAVVGVVLVRGVFFAAGVIG